MRVLIDAETYLYRAAASSEYEFEMHDDVWTYLCRIGDAKVAFEAEVARVEKLLPDHEIHLVFGDRTNFRYAVYGDYKSSRRKARRPAGYRALTDWAGVTWPSTSICNVEGDDVIGLMYRDGDVVYSRDKDLKTIPGLHLLEGEVVEVTPLDADRAFFGQVITGDATDGYPGIKGAGPVAAQKILGDCLTPEEMWQATLKAYLKAGETQAFAVQMARCARILREGEYDYDRGEPLLWNPPVPG